MRNIPTWLQECHKLNWLDKHLASSILGPGSEKVHNLYRTVYFMDIEPLTLAEVSTHTVPKVGLSHKYLVDILGPWCLASCE